MGLYASSDRVVDINTITCIDTISNDCESKGVCKGM